MSENPVKAGLSLIVGLIAIGAIALAFGGYDPTIAVDIGLPVFLIGVFGGLAILLVNAASNWFIMPFTHLIEQLQQSQLDGSWGFS